MCAGSRAGEGRNPTRNLPQSCSSRVWWPEQPPVPNLRAASLGAGMNLLWVLGVSSSQTSCSWTLSRKTTAKGKIRGEVRDMQCWAMNSRNFSAAMCEVMPQQSCTSCSSSLSSWTLPVSLCPYPGVALEFGIRELLPRCDFLFTFQKFTAIKWEIGGSSGASEKG